MLFKFLVAGGRQTRQQCFPEFFCLLVLSTSMYLIASLAIYQNGTSGVVEDKDRQMPTSNHPQPRIPVHTFQDTRLKVEQLIAAQELRNDQESYIHKQRKLLADEMKNFQFSGGHSRTLEQMTLEHGGQPIRNLIVSTWRSGSTFLGEIVNTHPGSYYHYEPFAHFDNYTQVDYPNLGEESLTIIRDLFNCQYDNLTDYTKYVEINNWIYWFNRRLWKSCEKNTRVCWEPSFISRMCRLFPIQSMKTVRMRLKLAKSLLEDSKLDLRVLLLVRDPRGTMNSRTSLTNRWCYGIPSCISEQSLCSELEEDFKTAAKFREEYPHRFMAMRYEDIALNPHDAVRKVFKFFRLEYQPVIKKYLDDHTKGQNETTSGDYTTYRDSNSTAFHWRSGFIGKFDEVKKIQSSCDIAMSLWGYRVTKDESNMKSFNPLDQPPWKEMNVKTKEKIG